jgi:hypothetical protein
MAGLPEAANSVVPLISVFVTETLRSVLTSSVMTKDARITELMFGVQTQGVLCNRGGKTVYTNGGCQMSKLVYKRSLVPR